MKGMKGRFVRKLKSISSITALSQGLFFQVNPSNQNPKEQSDETKSPKQGNHRVKDEEVESVSLLLSDKEGFGSAHACSVPLPAIQLLEESPTSDFEPNPLELMVKGTEEFPTLRDFQEKCPPGGNEAVILYTTSMRGVRKTFEDCSVIRFLLESFRVVYYERDVSMHLEFREELWRISGSRVVPPRLFVKGRDIGRAEEVVRLHEQGRLRKLFCGIPLKLSNKACNGCAGVRFVVCFKCNGSRKVSLDELTDELFVRCSECNENGLIMCPVCC